MIYKMGVMDLYPIAANHTKIENNPFLQVKLNNKVNIDRLYEAVKKALQQHPLFGCTLVYDGQYSLKPNNKEFKLFSCSQEDRLMQFGDHTNGFLWQICVDECTICMDWCHGVSDGRGGYSFFTSILCHYFDVSVEVKPNLELGLETFYDPTEEGFSQKKQEKGFKAKDLPYIKRGYKTDVHILKVPMCEVLKASKRNDSSPAAVLPPLFSMALRKHINEKAKNKNVSCNIVIDCRTPMHFNTMHNCILSKIITYVDRYDTMDFALVSTIYRAILDLALQKENIVVEATKMINDIKPLVSIKPRFIQKQVAKIVASTLKHTDSNFTFTYLGKMDLPKEVMDNIVDFNFRSWTDFGECNIAAVDFNGTLILNICENYVDKTIINDFIKISEENGIHFEYTDTFIFEQSNLRLKGV